MSDSRIPDKPDLAGLEDKWDAVWDDTGIYHFDATKTRDEVFSIDTPPPTVSGSLHVGHVFSYTHTDTIARYRRMAGSEVFYPMGWDDNGLPTERRVQNYFGVRCDPSLPYDPDFAAPADAGDPKAVGKRPTIAVSRPNFIELCVQLTAEDEKAFEGLFRRLGLSVDWTRTYETINDHCRRISQLAFLDNLNAGQAYQIEAPSLWDVTFQTAVAQAELEDKEMPGAYHKLRFAGVGDTPDIWIDTTRPELVPACVALVAHPDDERYQPYFGGTVSSPLFGVEVPVVAHELAQPDKGTGIAMICTFGDTTDVTWWRELDLPVRTVIQRDGKFAAETPDWIPEGAATGAYQRLAGLRSKNAQDEIAAMLAEAGEMDGDPRPITHPVKFFEKGDKPLEIVSSRQWYIRNGGRDDDLRQALIDRGDEMNWVPSYMQTRYTSWIEGLNGDWLISRQRFFGVPIPLWYPLDAAGEPVWDQPLIRPRINSRSTRRPTFPPATTRRNAARPRASWANPTSWTPGRRRRSRRRSRPAGEPTRTSTPAPSRWTSAHRRTTSSAPGCSRPLSGRTSMPTPSRGRTARSAAGSSIRIARRCRSRRATSSSPPNCSSNTAPTPFATGHRRVAPAPTRRSTKAR
jgi:valyl-tRNA synthetase